MIWGLGEEKYRLATQEDLPAIAEMLEDPEVGRWLWFTPLQRDGVEAYFGPLLEAQRRDVAAGRTPDGAVFVVTDEEGTFLGQGAAMAVVGSPGGYEIGYQLARAAWGRGVGTRLSRFLCAWAVYERKAYRVEASCIEGNAGSQKILKNLGLKREGRRPGYRLKEGRHAELFFGALAADLDRRALRKVAVEAGLLESQEPSLAGRVAAKMRGKSPGR